MREYVFHTSRTKQRQISLFLAYFILDSTYTGSTVPLAENYEAVPRPPVTTVHTPDRSAHVQAVLYLLQSTMRLSMLPAVPRPPVTTVHTPDNQNFHTWANNFMILCTVPSGRVYLTGFWRFF